MKFCDPSLIEAFRFFAAAAVVFVATLFVYRNMKKEEFRGRKD